MIVKFQCANCGCTDVNRVEEYKGWLGYESYTCLECGCAHDANGSYPAEKWHKTSKNQKQIVESKNGEVIK